MWKNRLAFALLYAALLALLTAGQLRVCITTSGSRAITRRAVAWCLGISAVLCACAVGLSGTEMPSVDRLRQSQKLIFKADFPHGIDAALGWETSAMRTPLPSVKPGEYEACERSALRKPYTAASRLSRSRACARSVRAAALGKKCEEKLENAP